MEKHDLLHWLLCHAFARHFLNDPPRVADLDGALHDPGHTKVGNRSTFLETEAALETGGKEKARRAMKQPAAEDCRFREFRVGVDSCL